MLILNRAELARGETRVGGQVPASDPGWAEAGVTLLEPLEAELVARQVGDGILVRGSMRTRARFACRRCLADLERAVDEPVDLLFAPLSDEEAEALDGELYPLRPQDAEIDLSGPLREQMLLRLPEYVVCREECRGLCPQCGADRNVTECACVPERDPGPWDALKNLKFD